jgi:hypothetical protein
MKNPNYNIENVASVNVVVDVDGLNKTMLLYVNALGSNIEKVFKRQARLLCQDMLDYTMPYDPDPPESGTRAGRNGAAHERGIKSMEADLDYLFAPLAIASYGDIARTDNYGIFVAWLQDRRERGVQLPHGFKDGLGGVGEWQKFQSTYIADESYFTEEQTPSYDAIYGGSSIESTHVKMRGGTRTKDYKEHIRDSHDVFLVAGYDKKMAAYKKKVAKRVGALKAGWYSAGMAIGDAKLSAPSWIIGNQWGTGIMENQLASRPILSITVGNSLQQDLMTKPRGVNEWQRGLSHRAYSIRNELAKRLGNSKSEKIEAAIAKLEASGNFDVSTENPF